MASGQSVEVYGGGGLSFDGFFRDEEISKIKSSQTFLVSPVAALGVRYQTNQNFDIMLDGSLGLNRIQLPVPDGSEHSLRYEQIAALVLAGSGLNIHLANDRVLTPSVHLGAGFFDFWKLETDDPLSQQRDFKTDRWTVVCGAGLEYQFKIFVPTGVNFRLIYTPLDIFREPVEYEVQGPNGVELLKLQGKLLQLQLSYRIYIPVYSAARGRR